MRAFPDSGLDKDLTLLDHYAMAALTGLLAAEANSEREELSPTGIAGAAFDIASAMLEEREDYEQ